MVDVIPDPEFVKVIAAWALKDAARRNPVEAVERALADYGSPKIGTDEYVSVRHAAVVKSTTARLAVSWLTEQPTAGSDGEVREWLTYMDEAIDNEEDTRTIAAINAFLDERDRLAVRVAELEAASKADAQAMDTAMRSSFSGTAANRYQHALMALGEHFADRLLQIGTATAVTIHQPDRED